MTYYNLEYSSYPDRPDTLFCKHTYGKETKNISGTRFIVGCETHTAGNGCLSWVEVSETALTQTEAVTLVNNAEWKEAEV